MWLAQNLSSMEYYILFLPLKNLLYTCRVNKIVHKKLYLQGAWNELGDGSEYVQNKFNLTWIQNVKFT